MNKLIATFIIMSLSCCLHVTAEDFISTDMPEKTFTLGVRLGVNTSNRTLGKDVVSTYNHQSWGAGFDAGVVADINFRNYLSIQPGVFFESKNGDYSLVESFGKGSYMTQNGKRRVYNITIPVVASFHFNLTDNMRWDVDFGPYVSLVMNSKMKNNIVTYAKDPADVGIQNIDPIALKAKGTDFGLKFGTGMQLFNHYYVGVHYLAGLTTAWKDIESGNYSYSLGGRTKAWVFSIGYNF